MILRIDRFGVFKLQVDFYGFIEVLGAAVSMMSSSSTYGVASNKGGVKALEEETAREMIDKLAKDEGNDVCADCGEVSECSN